MKNYSIGIDWKRRLDISSYQQSLRWKGMQENNDENIELVPSRRTENNAEPIRVEANQSRTWIYFYVLK